MSWVQVASSSAAESTGVAGASLTGVRAGDGLVCFVVYESVASAQTLTDSSGTTWAKSASVNLTGAQIAIFETTSAVTGGTHTVTASFTGGGGAWTYLIEDTQGQYSNVSGQKLTAPGAGNSLVPGASMGASGNSIYQIALDNTNSASGFQPLVGAFSLNIISATDAAIGRWTIANSTTVGGTTPGMAPGTSDPTGADTYGVLAMSFALRKTIFITSGTTFSAPADWPGIADVVECIGGGGASGNGLDTTAGGGGGGGAYTFATSVVAANGASLQVGAGGASVHAAGTDTWFGSTTTVLAKAGLGGNTNSTGGVGGAAASCVPPINAFSGGTGGPAANSTGGGGGGGAAGPSGAGANGGQGAIGGQPVGGGGGGGASGGTAPVTGSGSTGATGGKNRLNSGAGVGGANTVAGSPGSAGGGGGGGGGGAGGGNGGNGTDWDGTHGAGGGGGGSGRALATGPVPGTAGLYGAGGAGPNDLDHVIFGSGAQGIIVITYSPLITQQPLPQPVNQVVLIEQDVGPQVRSPYPLAMFFNRSRVSNVAPPLQLLTPKQLLWELYRDTFVSVYPVVEAYTPATSVVPSGLFALFYPKTARLDPPEEDLRRFDHQTYFQIARHYTAQLIGYTFETPDLNDHPWLEWVHPGASPESALFPFRRQTVITPPYQFQIMWGQPKPWLVQGEEDTVFRRPDVGVLLPFARPIPPTVTMPNLIGLTQAAAIAIILADGLLYLGSVFADEIYWQITPPTPWNPTGPFPPDPRGIVIAQWPLPGTAVQPGVTEVILVLSSGRDYSPGTGNSTSGNVPNTVIGSTTFP